MSEPALQIGEVRRAGAIGLLGRLKFSDQFSECACPILAGLKMRQIERDRVGDSFTEFGESFRALSFTDHALVVLQLRKCLRLLFRFEETSRTFPVLFEAHYKL